MKITINDIAILDTKNCTLYLVTSHEIIVELSETATFLFKTFLLKNREVILRDDLLKTVWEDRGYRASNSSLNNNVCAIRRAYSDITGGILQLKTIPKVGFEMSCDNISIDESVVEVYQHAIEGISEKKMRRIFYLFTCLTVLLSSSLIYYFSAPSYHINEQESPYLLTQVNHCSLYLINPEKDERDPATFIASFNGLLTEKNCKEKKMDVFFENDSVKSRDMFYVSCLQSTSGYSECNTTKNVFIDN